MQQENSGHRPSRLAFFLLLAAASAFAVVDKHKSEGSAQHESKHESKSAAPAHHSSPAPATHSGNSGRSSSGSQSSGSQSHSVDHSSGPSSHSTYNPGTGSHGAIDTRNTRQREDHATKHSEPTTANGPSTHVNDHNFSRDTRTTHNTGSGDHHSGPVGREHHDDVVDREHNTGHGPEHHASGPEHHDVHPAHYEAPRHITHEGNRTIARDNRGRVREIERPGLRVHRDFHGERHFVAERNGARVVGFGRGRGFTERRYIVRGPRVYVQRTYVYGGRSYAVAYRSYRYHGFVYYHYAPAYYYHPVFYGWAYRPWVRPVYYHWGWYDDPWYPAYGYYFRPYPVYPSAALWLTDFLLAENLRLAYEARANARAAAEKQYAAQEQYSSPQPVSGGQAALSPEVKQLIADEVQRQLAEERAAAAAPQQSSSAPPPAQMENAPLPEEVPAALDPNQHVFIVASNLDLDMDNGECTVTPGDVILRTGTAANENNKIAVNVVSSKQGDCPVNTNSEVEVSDLQEMHNHFREKMDSGLKNLADNQGKNGLPSAPDTGTTAGEVPPPNPDQSAQNALQDEQRSADEAERDIPKSGPGN
jgi:hypothetical protein